MLEVIKWKACWQHLSVDHEQQDPRLFFGSGDPGKPLFTSWGMFVTKGIEGTDPAATEFVECFSPRFRCFKVLNLHVPKSALVQRKWDE